MSLIIRWFINPDRPITKEFIAELSTSLKNPKRDKHVTDIIVTKRGGDPALQGTWIHPDLAVHLAMWLSPKFAVKVARWVNEEIS